MNLNSSFLNSSDVEHRLASLLGRTCCEFSSVAEMPNRNLEMSMGVQADGMRNDGGMA